MNRSHLLLGNRLFLELCEYKGVFEKKMMGLVYGLGYCFIQLIQPLRFSWFYIGYMGQLGYIGDPPPIQFGPYEYPQNAKIAIFSSVLPPYFLEVFHIGKNPILDPPQGFPGQILKGLGLGLKVQGGIGLFHWFGGVILA